MEYYTVEQNDTLESIASLHGITADSLKVLNHLETDPEVGTQLALPQQNLSLTNEVYYCTSLGKVKGILTVTEHVIVFEPHKLNDLCEILTTTGKEEKDAAMFQTYIDLNDVINCNIVELQGTHGSRSADHVFFIEFMLSRTGREKRGVRSGIPKVNVYFKLANMLVSGQSLQYIYLKTKADQVIALVSSSMLQVDRTREDSGTYVPFYEVNKGYIGMLSCGLAEEDEDEEFKQLVAEILSEEPQQQGEDFCLPEMSAVSRLLTPKMITQIFNNIPKVFQHRSWGLLYCLSSHGRSLSSFYLKTEKSGPNILVLKDNHRHVFGGYFSTSWRKCFNFYGTGESFVFTFRNTERMKIFYSTLANTCFMASDNDAIMIGSGGAAAIYIEKGFEAGSSGKSRTFNNQVLSGEDHFQIIDMEVWALL